MNDAGQYFCKTNADCTDGELIVECKFLKLSLDINSNNGNCFLDANKFKKQLIDQTAIEREKVVFEVEVTDPTATPEWFFKGEPIQESDK